MRPDRGFEKAGCDHPAVDPTARGGAAAEQQRHVVTGQGGPFPEDDRPPGIVLEVPAGATHQALEMAAPGDPARLIGRKAHRAAQHLVIGGRPQDMAQAAIGERRQGAASGQQIFPAGRQKRHHVAEAAGDVAGMIGDAQGRAAGAEGKTSGRPFDLEAFLRHLIAADGRVAPLGNRHDVGRGQTADLPLPPGDSHALRQQADDQDRTVENGLRLGFGRQGRFL